jgi:hypothetical protein
MVDIASLAIQIDTSDVSRAERDLERLGSKGAKSERAAKGVGDAHDKATGKVGALGTSARKTGDALDKGARSAGAYAGKIAAMAAPLLSVAAAMAAINKVSDVQRQFDVLNAGLVTATGSAKNAQVAFSALQDFARQTPYDLAQAVEGFTKLVNLGLTPSEKALRSYGNTASALGKDLNQMIEAVADASTGEFERLKEFGIKAKQNGEQVSLTFQGMTKTIGNNAAEIEKYLTDLGENQFAGAMTQRMATLDGAISNLGDSWDAFARNISNAGAGDLMEEAVRQAIDALDELNAQLESGQLEAQLGAISGKFDGWGGDIAQTLDIVGDIFESATGRWGALVDNNVENMTSTFANFPENVRAFIQLMTVEVLNGFDKVIAYSAAFKDGIKAIFTDDTMEGVGARLEAELQRLNELRDDSIASILEERDAALTSYSDQMSAAQDLRKVYDDAMERSAQATADRLAKFKALGSSAGAAGDAVEKLGKKLKNLDATGPGDAINDYIKQFEKLHDELNPAEVAAREYGKQQDLLNDIIARGGENADKARGDLAKLREQYEENNQATSEWAKWTEGALDRVDGAFADAWRNIGDGFSSFRDSLTNAFKQMLAELAHMAITRPIVLQIGAALGIGGMAGQSSGLFGMLGGGSGGGMGGMLSSASNLYSLFQAGQGQGLLGSIFSGFKSGGFGGAFNGATSYFGNMFGGIDQGLGQIYGVLTNGAGSTYAPLSYQAGVQGWGNMAATAAPWLAGGLGALMGYQNAGVKGAAAGAGGAAAGYYAGSALGSVVPGLGTAIGGAIGAALGGVLGGSLFGGKWQTKDVGIALGIESGSLSAQEFEYQKKKGGLFSSNKKRTRYYDLDPETAAALGDAYAATADGVFDLFESLSFTIEDSALAGLDLAKTNISTMGKTEEEIQQAIAEWFGTAANAMTAELQSVFSTGLDLDFAGMQAFVGNLKGVNEVIRYLNVGMYDASVAGGKLAEALSAAAGGLDALAANSQTYYGAFFSEAEKVEDTIDSIQRAFESADVELASSRQAYREMVEDIDLTTEAGREMFATLMQLSGQAAQYFSIVEQQAAQATAAANAALFGAVDTAYAALQRSIANQQRELQAAYSARVGSLNDMAATASANLSGMTSVASSLDAALKRLRGTSDDAVRMLRAQAVMTLNSALVTARAGGSLAGFEGLQDALDVASEMDGSLYGSLEDFEREQGRTANLVAELEKVNGKQLTTEERLLETVHDQLAAARAQYEADMAGLDAQLAFAQAQLDALNGIDNSVKSVDAAIAAMNASVVAALSGMADGLASKNTTANNSALIDSVYKSVLGRETDDAGKAFWQQQLASGDLDYDQLAKAIANDASKNPSDPGAGSAADYLSNQGGLSVQDQVEAAYRATLGRSADAAGESYWMGQVNAGMSVAEMIAAIERDAKINGEIPGFASGGFTGYGDKYDPAGIVHKGEVVWSQSDIAKWGGVGAVEAMRKGGPELEVTGPSRIYSAGQTAAMLGGGDSTAAIASLQRTVEGQSAALRSIAKHTMQTAKRVEFLERWDFDGLPKERATA